MTEPFVSKRLDAMPYKTAVIVVFVTAMVVAICAGTLMALTPNVWNFSSQLFLHQRGGINSTSLHHAYAIGVSGFFVGIGPAFLSERTTPMFVMFIAACLVALGWLLLFLCARSIISVPWAVVGLFYFFIGLGSFAAIISSVSTVSLNSMVCCRRR
jgi:hypothetical protein